MTKKKKGKLKVPETELAGEQSIWDTVLGAVTNTEIARPVDVAAEQRKEQAALQRSHDSLLTPSSEDQDLIMSLKNRRHRRKRSEEEKRKALHKWKREHS